MKKIKKYKLRELLSKESEEELKQFSPFLSHFLFHRGKKNEAEAFDFLAPDYERHLHSPFLFADMEKAVSRILEAIKKKEKICIFSDYDADGIPGAVIFDDFFKKINFNNYEIYIPHRHNEGFGLNKEAVEKIAKNRNQLMITVDCGISNKEEVEYANKMGIDVIITDHHIPTKDLPKAYAIINPKIGSNYPFDSLSGAGVVFKLIQAIFQKKDFGLKKGTEKWFLDMVGISTCSDMVPLIGENRVLARYGIKVMQKSPRVGFVKLLTKLNINQKNLTEDDIGFMLAPRINAASRMGESEQAFKLFSTSDEVEADQLSEYLNKINDERKGAVSSIVKEVKKKLKRKLGEQEKQKEEGKNFKIIVAGNPMWRPSLLGLVANSLVEEHLCPVFLWGRDGKMEIKGSCRAGGNISVIDIMKNTADGIFNDFGGHKMSGGFSVFGEKIHFLEEELLRAYEKIAGDFSEPDEIFIDKKMDISDVSWDTYNEIEKLSPFGIGNSKPLFLFENIEIKDLKTFGKENNHLLLIFKKNNGEKISAIGFFTNQNNFNSHFEKGSKINLVATFEKSFFRNYPELRLRIVDII